MSLIEISVGEPCSLVSTSLGPDATKYAAAGVSPGRTARVLARYPAHSPRYLEVELDGERLITLPADFAASVFVRQVNSP